MWMSPYSTTGPPTSTLWKYVGALKRFKYKTLGLPTQNTFDPGRFGL